MRVVLTGGTGFVGPAIVRELLGRGHEVTVVVHRSRGPFRGDEPGLRFAKGDVTDPGSLRDAMAGHDAAIHLVAIRRGSPEEFQRMHVAATRHVLDAAREGGAQRFVHMSAEGVERRRTPYERTKMEAEGLVTTSGLAWTIFRPTFVTGPAEEDAGGFDHEFAEMARSMPALPSFDGGRFKVQPVAKEDVAQAFAAALEREAAVNHTYALAGPDVLTWNEYLQEVAAAVGRKPTLMPAPMWMVGPMASLLGGFDWFPASRDELTMLVSDHVSDTSSARRDLGFQPRPWRPALREALAHPPRGAQRRRAPGGKPRVA